MIKNLVGIVGTADSVDRFKYLTTSLKEFREKADKDKYKLEQVKKLNFFELGVSEEISMEEFLKEERDEADIGLIGEDDLDLNLKVVGSFEKHKEK